MDNSVKIIEHSAGMISVDAAKPSVDEETLEKVKAAGLYGRLVASVGQKEADEILSLGSFRVAAEILDSSGELLVENETGAAKDQPTSSNLLKKSVLG
jgi:hypothetical protein